MTDFSWHAVYYSELQSPYALLVMPLAFLAWRAAAPTARGRAVVPQAASLVAFLSLFFAVATMIDPVATGPLSRALGLSGTFAGTLVMFFFVLLGDLRVLLLTLCVARPERGLGGNLGHALALTLIVPIVAGGGYQLSLAIWPGIHSQVLWMIYEFGFFSLCVYLSRVWLPRVVPEASETTAYLRAVFGFSAAYYILWFAADVLIVSGLDLGWAIRIVPNQLYYAFWVPFVYFRFFSREDPSRGHYATGSVKEKAVR